MGAVPAALLGRGGVEQVDSATNCLKVRCGVGDMQMILRVEVRFRSGFPLSSKPFLSPVGHSLPHVRQ